jgi:TonB-dependent Receptor Plug Domain
VLLTAVSALPPKPIDAQQLRDLRGVVRSAADSAPLPGVRLTVMAGTTALPARTALTAANGTFRLVRVPMTGLRLSVSRPDIALDTVDVPDGMDSLTIFVRVVAVTLAPVVIQAEETSIARARFESEAQPSVVALDAADIARVPALLEPDVVRAVQYLPGTVAKNDYSIGYNVRGGESDQNLIELDGIPIFNPSHLGGLFSTFDADAVSRTDFYTGGFPADYPGRLSSVLDVNLRNGDHSRFGVSGAVSLLSSKLLAEGPAGPATWMVSARRTYLDAVVSTFTKDVLPYYFTDLLSKVTLPYGRRGSVSVTSYWGRDALNLELVSEAPGRDAVNLLFNWGNALAGVHWRQPLGSTALLETRAGISTFSTTLGIEPSLGEFTNDANLLTAQTVLLPSPGATHDLHIGAGVEAYTMHYAVGSQALETSVFQARYAPTVWSAFADDQWRAAGWLLLRPGIRVERVTGAEQTVVSPRLSFRAYLSDDDAIQGSVGRYHQAIHSIWDQELPITIYEFWIGADHYVPIGRADHVVLGYERWLSHNVQLTVEGYHKTFANLVRPNPADDLRTEGDEFVTVDGTSWGVDVLLRKHSGPVRGWIAYGFTKAERRSQGETYPPAHDRHHTLNVVGFLPGPLGSDLGVRFGYGSPLPYTGFVGEWDHRLYDAGDNRFSDYRTEPISATINGERYPAYMRLDAGFRWHFEKWGGEWEPYLEVANIYNRRNVFLYFFDYGDVPPTRTGVSQLPFLPTFGVEFRF